MEFCPAIGLLVYQYLTVIELNLNGIDGFGPLEYSGGLKHKVDMFEGLQRQRKEPVDLNFGCRYELKYLISESKAHALMRFVESYLPLDRYCKLQPNSDYPIVSLYLDSHNLQLCRESLEGHKNRFKLRIRSYTDDPDYPRFFEIKRRMNTVIIKDRAQVKHCNVARLLSELSLPTGDCRPDGDTLEQFRLYMNSINAKPVVKIRYTRQAYENGMDNRVRITFDRNIAYSVTRTAEVAFKGGNWQRHLTNDVVLEIKFTGCYPAWLAQMVKCIGLRCQSVSKYTRSIQSASS